MFKHLKQGLVVAVAAASLILPLTAAGSLSDDKVKIGVLSDMSGVYKSLEGPGAVIAAEMAIEDFGGSVMGKSIELISADHQNKPDIGASTAREWIDTKEVDLSLIHISEP